MAYYFNSYSRVYARSCKNQLFKLDKSLSSADSVNVNVNHVYSGHALSSTSTKLSNEHNIVKNPSW